MVTTYFKKSALAGSTLAVALLLAACGGTSMTSGVTKRAEAKDGYFGLVKVADLKTQTPAAFKGKNKVVIGTFAVGFDVEKADSNKAGGGLMGNGFGGKSSAYSKLTGVDNAVFATITEAAYKDFVAKLKAAGYEVVPTSELLASPTFAKAATYENPYVASSGGLLTAKNETRYFTPAEFGKNRSIQMDLGSVTGGFAFANGGMAASNYAHESGIPVLAVSYRVDYAKTGGHGSKWSMSSSIQLGQGLTLEEGGKVGIVGGQMSSFSSNVGNVSLGQPITSDKEFATVIDSTTGTDKGLQVAANVIGVIGGVGTNSKRNYTVEADAGKYKTAAMDVLTQANGALVTKMQSLR